jgi:hypothetical protein
MAMSEELISRFMDHPASETVKARDTDIRNACALFCSVIIELTPYSREQSVAITKIEEVMFWARAALDRAPESAAAEQPDPLENLSDDERARLPFVLREGMSKDQIYRVNHLHGKDGRCIRNRFGPLCTDPGTTEGTGPKISIVHDEPRPGQRLGD